MEDWETACLKRVPCSLPAESVLDCSIERVAPRGGPDKVCGSWKI